VEGHTRAPLLHRVGAAAAQIGSSGPSRRGTRLALQWGLALLIFGCLLFFVLRQWSKLPDYDWRFEPAWLVLSGVGLGIFYFAQAAIWRQILRALGGRLQPRASRSIWGKSLIARYVPTNALLIVGRMVLAERQGVSKRVTLASVAYELGLSLCTAVIVGAYFVITMPALEHQPARFAVLPLIPLALAALHPRVFGPVVDFGLRKLGREPLPSTLPFRRVLEFALLYLGCWAAIGIGVFAFAAAVHPMSASDLPYIAASYPVAFCVAVLTFIVPSGLGTRDATLATAMAAVLAGTVATAVAVGFRLFQTALELIFVAVVVALDRSR
jgi:uncharacterized membrane protein YbhN (UPF0104 family)